MMAHVISEFKPSHPPCNNRLPPPFAPTIVRIRMQKNIKTANPSSASIMYNRTVLPCLFQRQPEPLIPRFRVSPDLER